MDTKGGRKGRMNWETGTDIYTLLIPCIKQVTNENPLWNTGSSTQCPVVTQMGRKPGNEGICVWHTADSLCCTVEDSTAVRGNYTPIKFLLKSEKKLNEIKRQRMTGVGTLQ